MPTFGHTCSLKQNTILTRRVRQVENIEIQNAKKKKKRKFNLHVVM